MGLNATDSPLQVLAAWVAMLFFDTYETLATLDEWLREVFLSIARKYSDCYSRSPCTLIRLAN